jgi:hypothetical protein
MGPPDQQVSPKICGMSFTDRLVLWLHIGFAIFTVGPVALAISSTPRYIRRRDVPVLRYLTRITAIFTVGSLLVLVFGIVLGQLNHDYSKPWLTAAGTLFVVAIVLLVLIIRDQRRAIRAIAPGLAAHAGAPEAGGASEAAARADPADPASERGAADRGGIGRSPAEAEGAGASAGALAQAVADEATLAADIASVERGRIAAMGGVVNLIWLVILVLMVWQP